MAHILSTEVLWNDLKEQRQEEILGLFCKKPLHYREQTVDEIGMINGICSCACCRKGTKDVQ